MYRSTFHWRPLLNGYSSYYPAGFGERMTIADHLPDADALTTLRRETGLDAILVHLDLLRNGYSSYYPAGFGERMTIADHLPDADALTTLRRETGLDAILVHLDLLR